MTYRGHEIEELKEMSHEDLAEIMNTRARRKHCDLVGNHVSELPQRNSVE
ncbi:hypothetical protein HRED_03354 [Candidatus Haloredivivus sp. G17]|nr:hypothetical protein HRED_03354 [Candidatus Haloredivivus sp. G17]